MFSSVWFNSFNLYTHTHTHTHTQVLIVIAQSDGTEEGLDTALFWGIRLTVVSTAINPLLYGIMARQYRLAYYYVGRLWLSKCCSCVDPPLKDIFGEFPLAVSSHLQDKSMLTRVSYRGGGALGSPPPQNFEVDIFFDIQ